MGGEISQPLSTEESAKFANAQKKYGLGVWLAVLSSAVGLGGIYFLGWRAEVAFAVLGAGWLPFYVIAYRMRRCPRCQTVLGNRPVVEFCTKCGVRLVIKAA